MKRTARDIWYYIQAYKIFTSEESRLRIFIASDDAFRELYVKRDKLTGQIGEKIFLWDPDLEIFDEPYALNLQDAINQIRIPEAVQPAPTRALPIFRYYAAPIENIGIQLSSDCCDCCRKSTGYIYKTNYGFCSSDDTPSFCPWCIANGKAASKFRGEFNESEWGRNGQSSITKRSDC